MLLKNSEGGDLIVYRGECCSADISTVRSKLPSIYFGTVETANVYAKGSFFTGTPRVYPVRLSMERPFINQPNDPFLDVSTLMELLGFDRAYGLALKYSTLIEATDHWRERLNKDERYSSLEDYLAGWPENKLGGLYFQAYPFFTDWANIQVLVRLGYDGAIHAGSGIGSAGLPEYCVFNKSQIHYALQG